MSPAEAALRAGDLFQAASLTVTFFDVVLFDAVDHTLRSWPGSSCVDWVNKSIRAADWRLRPTDLDRLGDQLRTAPLEWAPLGDDTFRHRWANFRVLRAIDLWQEHILIEAVSDLGGAPALGHALFELSPALHQEAKPEGDRPANFRNMIIHSLPPEAEITRMASLFDRLALWRNRPGQARSFLDDTLARRVLDALGIADPLALYRRAETALAEDIERCPLA